MESNYKTKILNILSKINWSVIFVCFIILCGIILRLKVYFYNSSFFGDEAALGLNIIEKNYFKLFEPLKIGQVAPPFFMVVCKFILDISQQAGNIVTRDLVLRLFPCLCSIISLPLFAYLIHKMFDNKYMLWVCTAMLAFNTTAINYAQEFKQYSCEMMFALILLIAFLHLDIKTVSNKKLGLYCTLFMLSIWFSNTACIIIFTGYLLILADAIKNKYFDKVKAAILLLPMLADILAYYFLFFRRVNRAMTQYMHDFWSHAVPSFFNINNFTELFPEKIQQLISFPYTDILFVFLFINILILFSFRDFKYRNKYVVLIPILLSITAAFLKIYPFEQRLILFLLPLLIILYCQTILLLKKSKTTTVILLIIISALSLKNIFNPADKYVLHKQYLRQFAQIINQNNPEYNNLYILFNEDPTYYYIKKENFKCLINTHYNNTYLDKQKAKQIIKSLPSADIWLLGGHYAQKHDNGSILKEYMLQDKNLKVYQIWMSPYHNKNVFLIHFKKIKDYN